MTCEGIFVYCDTCFVAATMSTTTSLFIFSLVFVFLFDCYISIIPIPFGGGGGGGGGCSSGRCGGGGRRGGTVIQPIIIRRTIFVPMNATNPNSTTTTTTPSPPPAEGVFQPQRRFNRREREPLTPRASNRLRRRNRG